jgi:hypothetical protein
LHQILVQTSGTREEISGIDQSLVLLLELVPNNTPFVRFIALSNSETIL